MTERWRDLSRHWEDWLNMVLGAALVVAPTALGFADLPEASYNSFVAGAALFGIALLALVQFELWEEWLNGAIGLWLIASPWILGFADHETAMWTHLAVGAASAILAAIELWEEHLHPGTESALHA
jgi:hypothetical protein